jgi:hypothetical protein
VRLAATSLNGQTKQAGVTFGANAAKPLQKLESEQAVEAEDARGPRLPFLQQPGRPLCCNQGFVRDGLRPFGALGQDPVQDGRVLGQLAVALL